MNSSSKKVKQLRGRRVSVHNTVKPKILKAKNTSKAVRSLRKERLCDDVRNYTETRKRSANLERSNNDTKIPSNNNDTNEHNVVDMTAESTILDRNRLNANSEPCVSVIEPDDSRDVCKSEIDQPNLDDQISIVHGEQISIVHGEQISIVNGGDGDDDAETLADDSDTSVVLHLASETNERNMIKIRAANKDLLQRTRSLEKNMKSNTKKIDDLSRDVRDLRKVLKYQSNIRPFPTTYLDEENYFPLLPEKELTKKKQVKKMETRIQEDKEYKRQWIMKVSTMGGSTAKKRIIRIFKRIFSTELRSKMCWIGTSSKLAFKDFKGILDVLRQGTGCTEDEIEAECKLRFRQSNTDWDREQARRA